jgi:glucose-6-phosphate isomerase
LGRLIALFERAVGLYASLVGINAYHQPGVEAGKKAAEKVITLQAKALSALTNTPATAAEIAARAGEPGATEAVYHVLRRLSSNPSRSVKREAGAAPAEDRFLTA